LETSSRKRFYEKVGELFITISKCERKHLFLGDEERFDLAEKFAAVEVGIDLLNVSYCVNQWVFQAKKDNILAHLKEEIEKEKEKKRNEK
jgi:hypothetical protein